MVKILFIALVAAVFAVACSKVNPEVPSGMPSEETARKMVTITVAIPEGGLELPSAVAQASSATLMAAQDWTDCDTKVAMVQDPSDYKIIKPSWEEGDILEINGSEFTLSSEPGSPVGQFIGEEPEPMRSGKYRVTLKANKHTPADYNNQVQSADGNLDHLGYSVTIDGAPRYDNISLTQSWAASCGATLSGQCSVLRLRAKLPAAVAPYVRKVIFSSSAAAFNGSNTLTVTLETPGTAGSDNILDVYATLPPVDDDPVVIPDIKVTFQVGDDEHAYDKYTHYRTLGGKTVQGGTTIVVNADCSEVDKFANGRGAGLGTSAQPYLIFDQHQMDGMHALMAAATDKAFTHFSLQDDVDMTGIEWVGLNNNGNYQKWIHFDGHNHRVSNLTCEGGGENDPAHAYPSLFGVLYGSVQNLVIENATIIPKGNVSGILAGYIVSTSNYSEARNQCAVRNVTIRNSQCGSSTDAVASTGRWTGAVAGHIYSTGTALSDITVENVSIYNRRGGVGGVVGTVSLSATAPNLSVSGSTLVTEQYGGTDFAAGGLFGRASAPFTLSGTNHVQNTSVTGVCYVGGVIGQVTHADVSISGCDGTGSVSGNRNVGGFVGMASGGAGFAHCRAYASVSASEYNVGGFVGYSEGAESYSDCYYRGTSVTSSYEGDAETPDNRQVNLGGFAGMVGDDEHAFTGSITDCHVIAPGNTVVHVTVTDANKPTRVGGFVGRIGIQSGVGNTGRFEACHCHMVQPTGSRYVGGLAGVSYVNISKCYTTGASDGVVVASTGECGGLVGYQVFNKIEYSYSTVSVSCANSVYDVGGLVGKAKTATLEQCYACGTVSGKNSSTGGVVGKLEGSSTAKQLISWSKDASVAATRYYGSKDSSVVIATLLDGTTNSCYSKPKGSRYFSSVAHNLEWDEDGVWSFPAAANEVPTLNL